MAEKYIQDMISLLNGLKSGIDKKTQNYKASAEFALNDLIDQFDESVNETGISFMVNTSSDKAVAGTTYVDFGCGVGVGTALVSFENGCGRQLLEFMDEKFPNGFACHPINEKVANYYDSILNMEFIGKIMITSKAPEDVKLVFKNNPNCQRLEGLD